MYDYATASKQTQILTELNALNSNFTQFSVNIYYLLILFIIVLMSFGIYKFVMKCLGK